MVNVLDGMRRGGREGAAAEILVVWREKMYGRGRTHDAGCGKDLVCHAEERTRRGTLDTGGGRDLYMSYVSAHVTIMFHSVKQLD
jgi:hypothetical protein